VLLQQLALAGDLSLQGPRSSSSSSNSSSQGCRSRPGPNSANKQCTLLPLERAATVNFLARRDEAHPCHGSASMLCLLG
jgi:hypothetical protein